MPRIIKHSRVVSADKPALIPDAVFVTPLSFSAEENSSTGENSSQIEQASSSEFIGSDYKSELRKRILEEISEEALRSAQVEREKILRAAEADAQKIKAEAQSYRGSLLAELEADREILMLQTRAETEKTVRAEAEQAVEDCMSRLDLLLEEMRSEQNKYFEEYEKELKYFALDIAQKVLHTHISENGTALAELVKDAVGTAKNVEWLSVEVSDKLVVLVHKLRKDFLSGEYPGRPELRPKDIPIDSCIVRTDEGVTDASVSAQLQTLRELFEDLDKQNL